MRLGEFRSKTRELDNKLKIRLSVYEVIKHNVDGFVELEIDSANSENLFLRVVEK